MRTLGPITRYGLILFGLTCVTGHALAREKVLVYEQPMSSCRQNLAYWESSGNFTRQQIADIRFALRFLYSRKDSYSEHHKVSPDEIDAKLRRNDYRTFLGSNLADALEDLSKKRRAYDLTGTQNSQEFEQQLALMEKAEKKLDKELIETFHLSKIEADNRPCD